MSTPCKQCDGLGWIGSLLDGPRQTCPTCGGERVVAESDTPRTKAATQNTGRYGAIVAASVCAEPERELAEMHATALEYARSSDTYSEQLAAERERNRKLHRRCQQAESVANQKIETAHAKGPSMNKVMLRWALRKCGEELAAEREAHAQTKAQLADLSRAQFGPEAELEKQYNDAYNHAIHISNERDQWREVARRQHNLLSSSKAQSLMTSEQLAWEIGYESCCEDFEALKREDGK